jgi:hypothetical protein
METTTLKTDFILTAVKRQNPQPTTQKQLTDYTKFIECVSLILEEKVIKASFEIRNEYDYHLKESYNSVCFWVTSEAKRFFHNSPNEYVEFKILDVETTQNSDILTTKRFLSISERHLQIVISESKNTPQNESN